MGIFETVLQCSESYNIKYSIFDNLRRFLKFELVGNVVRNFENGLEAHLILL